MATENGDLKVGRGVPWVVRGLPSCHGAFRQNTRVFLRTCGDEVNVEPAWPWRAWVVPLMTDLLEFKLQVYEEKNQHMSGVSCEPCRCNGWQHHPVSTRKYHFILPSDRDTSLPIRVSDSAPQLNAPVTTLENKSHLLHGVIHCNGFGHLLRINGLEGGSRALTGRQVMTLWDALCSQLQARSISIEDVSNRKGMLLRVLTPIYEKRTWYGRWDYEFGRGGYNIKKEQWVKAVEVANQAPLDKLLLDFEGVDPLLVEIVQRYRGEGDREVKTVGDWLARVCMLSRSHSGALNFAAREVEEQCKATKRIPEPSTPNGAAQDGEIVDATPQCNGNTVHPPVKVDIPPISDVNMCDQPTNQPAGTPLPAGPEPMNGLEGPGCAQIEQVVGIDMQESCPKSVTNHSSTLQDPRETGRIAQDGIADHPMGDARWPVDPQPLPALPAKVDGVPGDRAAIDSQHLETASGSGGSRSNGKHGIFLGLSGRTVLGNGNGDAPVGPPKKNMKRKFEPADAASPASHAVRRPRSSAPLPDSATGHSATPKPRALAQSEPPSDLVKPCIKLFNPQSLLEGPRRYSASKLSEFMSIVLGVLQTVEGRWIRLQELRETLYTTAHDRVLADWVLGRISNTLFGGFAIYKTRSGIGRCNYFLFEKMDVSETAAVEGHDPLCSVSTVNVEPPGPKIVAGRSLDRFNVFLAQLYAWLCAQPGIVIGRSSNILVKEVCPPRERRKRAPSGHDATEVSILHTPGVQRRTRSHTLMSAPPAWKYSKRMRVDTKTELKHRHGNGHHALVDPWLHQYASTVEPFIQLTAQRGPQPGAAFSAKNQVLVDLLYFYQNVVEIYKPVLQNFIQKRSQKVALESFPQSIQILKDTKLFVKDYDPIWMKRPLPGPKEGGNFVRLMCQVDLDPTIPPGHPHRTSDGSELKLPSFFQRLPPAEPVLVADNMSREDVVGEILKTFRNVYGMFQHWRIADVQNLMYSSDGVVLPPTSEIRVVGCNYRPELALRHAGGIEDWEVHCSCQAEDDDGARMVACDNCGVWMHTRCVGFRDDEDIPEYFNCPGCIANLCAGSMCNGA